jgi:Ataxin-3
MANSLIECFVYHEKQVASLCGQHCLNNLLQGPYFTFPDLGAIAKELDDKERSLRSSESKPFESCNVDDSGNFSYTTMSEAVRRSHNLALPRVRMGSDVLQNPQACGGFVCNLNSHWFSIRPIQKGNRRCWFNLDSVKDRPELVSDFYLSAYIGQLQATGYSVFQVVGDLPPLMRDTSIGLLENWYPFETVATHEKPAARRQNPGIEEEMFQAAIQASLQNSVDTTGTAAPDKKLNREEVRNARLRFFEQAPRVETEDLDDPTMEELDDAELLALAIEASKQK